MKPKMLGKWQDRALRGSEDSSEEIKGIKELQGWEPCGHGRRLDWEQVGRGYCTQALAPRVQLTPQGPVQPTRLPPGTFQVSSIYPASSPAWLGWFFKMIFLVLLSTSYWPPALSYVFQILSHSIVSAKGQDEDTENQAQRGHGHVAQKHPARPNLFTLFHSICPLLVFLLDEELPRTNHLSLCTLRSWH